MGISRRIKLDRGSTAIYTKGSNSNVHNSYLENCVDSKTIFKVN